MRHLLQSNPVRLFVLTLVHFSVDFSGGLLIPLLQPTLTNHLGVSIGVVTASTGAAALVVNLVQPVSGWLLPKRRMPGLLLVCPLLSGVVALIGLSSLPAAFAGLLLISAVGTGLVHPEGAMTAHRVSVTHESLGISVYMAGGYLGFSLGGMLSGVWVESFEPDLWGFQVFVVPAGLTAVLVLATGLHRLHGGPAETATEHERGSGVSFALVMPLCAAIAANLCVLIRLYTVYLVRAFPAADAAAQGWGGTTVGVLGLGGCTAAFIWGWLAERFGPARLIAVMQLAAVPFLYQLLHVDHPSHAPWWGAGVAVTMGGVFPLSVVLARRARGPAQRLRLGLAVGGA